MEIRRHIGDWQADRKEDGDRRTELWFTNDARGMEEIARQDRKRRCEWILMGL